MPSSPPMVKSYWTTIAELFAACCPCIRRGKGPRNEYERLLDEQEDEVEDRLEESSALLRWLSLLLSGVYLPSNDQLYAVLFRCSGWLQGIGVSEQGDQTLLGPATGKVVHESQLLCKDMAKWLASRDAVLGGQGEQGVPNGNSRESIQRIAFHFSRLVRKPPQPTTDVEVEDVVPEVASVKAAAESGAEDLRLSIYSVAQLVIGFVTSRQLTNLLRDSLNFGRDMAADAVQAGVDTLASAEGTLRPSEQERNESLQEELEGMKQGAQANINVAAQLDPRAAKEAVQDLPSNAAEEARNRLPTLNGIAEATGRIIGELAEEDNTFREALQALVDLAGKYRDMIKTATEGRVADILPDVERSEDQKDKPPLFEWNQDVLELSGAARDLLEGMAGGKSLEPILAEVRILYAAVSDDIVKASDDWLSDVQAALTASGENADRVGQLQQSLSKLAGNLERIISDRPDLRSKVDKILSLSSLFLGEIRREPRLNRIGQRIQGIFLTISNALATQARGLSRSGSELLHDLISYILPALLKTLGNIPLPRVEYTSPQVDAALDDVRIAAFNLVPAKVKVRMTESFEWNRTRVRIEEQAKASVKEMHVEATGVRLAMKGVSFFVREKMTQLPSPMWVNGLACCGTPKPEEDEEGHLGAYREQAILDAGLFGRSGSTEGASMIVDLSKAPSGVSPFAAGEEEEDQDTRSPTFFQVNKAALKLSDSFDVRLRQSRHYILNTALLEPVGAPVARMVLESTLSGLVQHGLEVIDAKAADVYARAHRVAARRSDSRPEWEDYVRVLMNDKAGKTAQRLQREKKEREDAAAAEARIKAQARNAGQEASTQLEVKPLAILVHLSPDTSLSIGAYPTLLPSYAQGPTTQRTRIRNAVVRNEWQGELKQRADETLEELGGAVAGVKVAARGVGEGVGEVREMARESRELAGELREVRQEREEIIDDEEVDRGEREPEWYHPGFDL
ncbi:hypothetical protein BDZ90DRAFT_229893 [Jaminaea rosea]|uniref:HAM1-like N-terminal domain-containing protein n=1 Tax=Jaminaea rosea TaxID=1569628 RepID=A0A316V3X5_9BASI|nr:hypothetical protein BDZ90DRAFT_229893 [Jaminaea rosea]PWN30903.1 hypothetical protein BDZ90DRAFT_229893 [Jaminaea rosea]